MGMRFGKLKNVEVENYVKEEDVAEKYENDYEYISKKTLGKLVMLVVFTAIILISSTYAWFSMNKEVTIGNLEGTVNVVEGLEVSLDAESWSDTIVFSQYTNQTVLKKMYGSTEHNIIPTEMLPVSTNGKEGIGKTDITMYRGVNVEGIKLETVEATTPTVTDEKDNKYPGYYAIDIFVKNSSKTTDSNTDDVLQLNANSLVKLKTGGTEATGLQNTVRVALAKYTPVEDGTTASVDVTATPSQIINATTGSATIGDVAIWEPNSSNHETQIVENNNKITWYPLDRAGYIADQTNGKFTATEKVPTFGLLAKAATNITGATQIENIYDWSGTNSLYLGKQITLQTTKSEDSYLIAEGVQNLISVNSTDTAIYPNSPTGEVTTFTIPKNKVTRLRMFVWLEGQDVDCTNLASHGGGIQVNLGLTKDAEIGSGGETGNVTSAGTYLPTGFSEVEGTSLATGLTIQDSTGNQYVWIEVPQTTAVYSTSGLRLDLDNLSGKELTDAYTAIETDLHTYTSVYRNGTSYTDTYSGNDASTGLTSTQYTELKQKMLKSVYQNGGFYVGKYEAGIKDSYRNEGDSVTETAVVQENAYPFNWVICRKAQSLASGMESGEYTSSLMFGVQWDLMLKYLETKGSTVEELNQDSTSWGNVYNNTFTIENSNVKYSTWDYDASTYTEWLPATSYTHNENEDAMLTTGASSLFCKQNIYNIAGNMAEWTLEYTSNSSDPCAIRGGVCYVYGYAATASCRSSCSATVYGYSLGFRPSLF